MLAKEILDGQNIRHWRGVILDLYDALQSGLAAQRMTNKLT